MAGYTLNDVTLPAKTYTKQKKWFLSKHNTYAGIKSDRSVCINSCFPEIHISFNHYTRREFKG